MLKQQQQQQSYSVKGSELLALGGKPKITVMTNLKTAPIHHNIVKTVGGLNVTTLKRPFVMLAIFFVFGLNIFQFT